MKRIVCVGIALTFAMWLSGCPFGQEYTVTVTTEGEGSVALDPAGGSYAADTVLTLTAEAATGWVFETWEGGIESGDNPLEVTVTADLALTARFVETAQDDEGEPAEEGQGELGEEGEDAAEGQEPNAQGEAEGPLREEGESPEEAYEGDGGYGGEPEYGEGESGLEGESPYEGGGSNEGEPPCTEEGECGQEGEEGEVPDELYENPFVLTQDETMSTFSVDVDTASYARIRQILRGRRLPSPSLVRIEEMLNYFDYTYPGPEGEAPFSVYTETGDCPWFPGHRLLHIGLQGYSVPEWDRPGANLTFLIDVSGSMSAEDKLPWVKEAMSLLVEEKLDLRDRVGIVTYAGNAGVALESAQCTETGKKMILSAIDNLGAGGSTHGSEGIEYAYEMAEENFVDGGANRIILATDGDFNVGTTNRDALNELIQEKAESGVFLTVLGFGMSAFGDSVMETLADNGNGSYGYIDTLGEARKMLVDELTSNLITIAKDVKAQVEFVPEQVEAYRLIGYENRVLANEEFNDDERDAGELGSGHSVTALYELVMNDTIAKAADSTMLYLRLRYKEPDSDESELLSFEIPEETVSFEAASEDYRYAAAVAAFGMLLRESAYSGQATFDTVLAWATAAAGDDTYGYREEFLWLVGVAGEIAAQKR